MSAARGHEFEAPHERRVGSPGPVRCAVYTRKSSEEGLDQAFNSLDAQREAGLDYIRSQRWQGWVAVDAAYDDGGYSGGTLERPGLTRLLADVESGRVDVVVVYKVDRLSRSLADFAGLMRAFDRRGVSFVSVTQQFNTTTSMGRLTLNMLLSFAQFEREVTGERIRDKVAATKRRGVWVAGRPPLGYRVSEPGEAPGVADRRLRIVPHEAEIIRSLYAWWLETRSLLTVARRLNAQGARTRVWRTRDGRQRGGRPFTAQRVYEMLRNPVYAGKITHRPGRLQGEGPRAFVHQGLHEPIIDPDVWDAVSAALRADRAKAGARWTGFHLLQGKLKTFEGATMCVGGTRTSVLREGGRVVERRVMYYQSLKARNFGATTCPICGLNANYVDGLVRATLLDHLQARGADLRRLPGEERDRLLRSIIRVVTVGVEWIRIDLDEDRVPAGLDAARRACEAREAADTDTGAASASGSETSGGGGGGNSGAALARCLFTPRVESLGGVTRLTIPVRIKRHDSRRVLVSPEGRDLYLTLDPSGDPVPPRRLVRALGLAFAHRREVVERGRTVEDVAREVGVTAARVSYLLHLTRLGPPVLRAVLTGAVGSRVGVRDLHRAADHLDWSLQANALGV